MANKTEVHASAFADLAVRYSNIVSQVATGKLDVDFVLGGLEAILKGRPAETSSLTSSSAPSWAPAPDAQVRIVSHFLSLYGEGEDGFRPEDIPAIPADVSLGENEILLLLAYLPDKGRVKGLYRTLDAWCASAGDRLGFRSDYIKSNTKSLRLAAGVEYRPGVYWVVFDFKAGQGKSPQDCLQKQPEGTQLGGLASLILAVMAPEWVKAWGSEYPYPNLTGLEVKYNGAWSRVPYLSQWVAGGQFRLHAFWAGHADGRGASPVFREC